MGFLQRLLGTGKARGSDEPRDWSGWQLQATAHREVVVHLGEPLGGLGPRLQTALSGAIGEARYNACDSDDMVIEIDHLTDDEAAHMVAALHDGGFRVETTVRQRYFAFRRDDRGVEYVDDVSRVEMERIAREMIAAGVPVTARTIATDDPRLPPHVARAWQKFGR